MDEKKLMLIAMIGTAVIVAATLRGLKQLEAEQEKVTNETIKLLGEYRQYLSDMAKNN